VLFLLWRAHRQNRRFSIYFLFLSPFLSANIIAEPRYSPPTPIFCRHLMIILGSHLLLISSTLFCDFPPPLSRIKRPLCFLFFPNGGTMSANPVPLFLSLIPKNLVPDHGLALPVIRFKRMPYFVCNTVATPLMPFFPISLQNRTVLTHLHLLSFSL